MSPWIPVLVVIVLALAAVLAVYLVRSRDTVPQAIRLQEPPEDWEARRARQQAIDIQGSELLQRRIDLDAKRGTLGGDAGIDHAFKGLEERLRSGEIDEQQFELEKIKLLGG